MNIKDVQPGRAYLHSTAPAKSIRNGEHYGHSVPAKFIAEKIVTTNGKTVAMGHFADAPTRTVWANGRYLHGEYDTAATAFNAMLAKRNAMRAGYAAESKQRETAANNVAGLLSVLGVPALVIIDRHGERDEYGDRTAPTFGLRISAVDTIRLGDELARLRQGSE